MEEDTIEADTNLKEYYPKPGFMWTDPDDERHYGSCWKFAYWNGTPLCVIGPDCKLPQLKNSQNLTNNRAIFCSDDWSHYFLLASWVGNAILTKVLQSLCNHGTNR